MIKIKRGISYVKFKLFILMEKCTIKLETHVNLEALQSSNVTKGGMAVVNELLSQVNVTKNSFYWPLTVFTFLE